VEFNIDSFIQIIEEKGLIEKAKLEKLKEDPQYSDKKRESMQERISSREVAEEVSVM